MADFVPAVDEVQGRASVAWFCFWHWLRVEGPGEPRVRGSGCSRLFGTRRGNKTVTIIFHFYIADDG